MYNALMFPKFKWFDSNGDPASGWKVYTYENGTTTAKTSYQTPTGTANANPVVLDSDGEADIYLDGVYTIVLKNASDVTQWTLDDVQGAAIESVVCSVVASLAAIGTGDTDGEFRVDAGTGNVYTWDDGNSKWRIHGGNRYATSGLPASATYTIETGTIVFDTTVECLKYYDGSSWLSVPGEQIAKTASYAMTAGDVGALHTWTNDGCGVGGTRVIFTLPALSEGYKARFIVVDATDMQIKANTGDTIRYLGTQTAAAGYLESATVGNMVELEATADDWVIVGIAGAWDYDQ